MVQFFLIFEIWEKDFHLLGKCPTQLGRRKSPYFFYCFWYYAPSEAWHFLRGTSPRRAWPEGESLIGPRPSQSLVSSLAGVKERRKRMTEGRAFYYEPPDRGGTK